MIEPTTGIRSAAARRGLLVDWGGVMTTNVFDSFRIFCEREGLSIDVVAKLFRSDPDSRELLIGLETGALSEELFEPRFAAILGVDPDGLIGRLLGSGGADSAMQEAVRAARSAGIRTGLISNSWGTSRYDRTLLAELFDGVVISGEVGIRKPSPEIYELGVRAIGMRAGGVRVRRRPGVQPGAGGRARDGHGPAPRRRSDDRRARATAGREPAMRSRTAAALAAAGVLACLPAGCGGPGTLTDAQLQTRATLICDAARTRMGAIATPAVPADEAAFLSAGVRALEPELTGLAQLAPPSASAREYRRARAAMSAQLRVLRAALARLHAGADPLTEIGVLERQLEPYEAEADMAWSALSIPACADR